jgi:hypothetical protein
MIFSKKFFPALAAVSLLSAGLALVLPATAQATGGGLSVDTATISNGQAINVGFGTYSHLIPAGASPVGSQELVCQYSEGYLNLDWGFSAGDTVPASFLARDGDFTDGLNDNGTGIPRSYTWFVVEASYSNGMSPTCSDLPQLATDLEGFSNGYLDNVTISDSVSWTVLPALSSPFGQTLYVGQNNTTPVTYVHSHADLIVVPTQGSYWYTEDPNACDETNGDSAVDLAALGLHVDSTNSAPGDLASLLITGTPVAGSEGTYRLCLALEGDRAVKGFFDLTIADVPAEIPAVTPTSTPEATVLAATGVTTRSLTGTGFASLALMVFGGLAVIVRRRVAVKQ